MLKITKEMGDKIPIFLIADQNSMETLIPLERTNQKEHILDNLIENGFKRFIVIIKSVEYETQIKESVLKRKAIIGNNEVDIEFVSPSSFTFEGEYPTTLEPVYSDGKVTLGDAVFLGPNVYIGKDCILGDFVEITNSILLGKNTVGKKAKIENSIIGDDVDVPAGQIIKGGLILNNEKQN